MSKKYWVRLELTKSQNEALKLAVPLVLRKPYNVSKRVSYLLGKHVFGFDKTRRRRGRTL